MEHDGDGDINYNSCTWSNPHRIGEGTGRHGNKWIIGDHPDYTVIKISQYAEKSSWD